MRGAPPPRATCAVFERLIRKESSNMQRLFLTHSLFLFPAVVGVAVLASACGHPGAATSGVGGTQGTAGNNGGLGGNDGTAGITGGTGGAGNVMVIGPDAGAAGMAMKM